MTAETRAIDQHADQDSPDGTARPARGASRGAVAATASVAYVGATFLTDPVFVADTPDMAMSAVARVVGLDCSFLEPGHFLWRPTGYAMLEILGVAREGVSTDALLRQSQIQLGWAAWIAGFIAILCCAIWVQRRIGSLAALAFGVGAVLISKSFLNYSQVGVSYVPALACLMGALVLLSNEETPAYGNVLAGALLGASVLLWGTFVLALPAALASPFIFGRELRRGLRPALLAIGGGVATAVVAGVWASASLGFDSLAELGGWAVTADHGISTGGVPRAVLGFARSYLETGDYGKVVKRFLVGDPANPVSVRQLMGFPLVGILGFYLGLLVAIVAAFRHSQGRRALAFFAINAVPVGLFAVAWQGGDLERYLPLVPGVALLASTAFAGARPWQRAALAGWLLIMVIPNALTLGRPAVAAARERVRSTLRDVESPEHPRLLVFSHWQDERVQFSRNYPPRHEPLNVRFYHLLSPGTPSVEDWRRRAAARILSAFDAGTEVFVSERLVTPTPKPEWAWVSADDNRVSWSDFHAYFTALSYGDPVGVPGDAFLPLVPTAENRAILESHRDVDQPAGPAGCNLPAVVPAAAGAPDFTR